MEFAEIGNVAACRSWIVWLSRRYTRRRPILGLDRARGRVGSIRHGRPARPDAARLYSLFMRRLLRGGSRGCAGGLGRGPGISKRVAIQSRSAEMVVVLDGNICGLPAVGFWPICAVLSVALCAALLFDDS